MSSPEEKKARAAALKRAKYLADPEKFKQATRKYRQANPEKVNAAARRRYAKSGDAGRRRRRGEKYGLSAEQIAAMHAAQGGLCPICSRTLGRPHIDHDHDTGQVRELLCHGCNIRVGFIEKNLGLTLAAVAYLQRHVDKALDAGWPDD